MKFKIGDLVRPTKDHNQIKKHTARQCKIGIIVSWDKFQGSLLYKIHWWPFTNYFYFPDEALELVSRVEISDKLTLKELISTEND
jgi:hypothetical protein|tara:strand:+ start:63 stop:317 length:255 start_codon:yes stop_codon:yes gene_type:complete